MNKLLLPKFKIMKMLLALVLGLTIAGCSSNLKKECEECYGHADQLRDKPRPSDLVAKQPLGEADELGRGWIARTPTASFERSEVAPYSWTDFRFS